MPHTHRAEFRISDFGFAAPHARRVHHGASPYGLRPHKQAIIACHGVARRAKPDGAAVPAARAGGTPALQGRRSLLCGKPQSAWRCCGGPRREAREGAFIGGAWHPDLTLSSTSCRRAWHPLGKRFEKRAAWNSAAPPRNAGTETRQGFFGRLVRSCRISAMRSRIRFSHP
jgi:hypothetical protein